MAEKQITLAVPGMSCEGCAETIRETLNAVPGVSEVTTRLWRKEVDVRIAWSEVSQAELVTALGVAGYETTT